MLVLAAGSGMARVVGVLTIPLLTRIYSPEEFGLLAVFNAFLLLLLPLGTLRYVVALPLPRSDRAAMNLLALCAIVAGAATVILASGFAAFADAIFPVFSAERLTGYWWLVAVGFLAVSTYEILTSWATRKKAFRAVSRTQVTQALLGAGLKVGLGLLGLKPLGLLVGQVAQQAGGVVYLM